MNADHRPPFSFADQPAAEGSEDRAPSLLDLLREPGLPDDEPGDLGMHMQQPRPGIVRRDDAPVAR